jgi:CRP/FNR family transcriptional regulator
MIHRKKLSASLPEVFHYMSDKEFDTLDKTKYEVSYKAGEVIFKRGTKTAQLMFLTSGLAKSYIEGYGDKNLIIRLIKPFEIIGVLASYVGSQHQFSVMSIEDCKCSFYDLEIYKEIARNNSKVYDILTQSICIHSMQYYNKFISLTQKQVNGRIAETILYLYNDIYQTNPINLSITKFDIADMTGMSKDTATRVLKSLDNENIIKVQNNIITIIDIEKLTQISNNG